MVQGVAVAGIATVLVDVTAGVGGLAAGDDSSAADAQLAVIDVNVTAVLCGAAFPGAAGDSCQAAAGTIQVTAAGGGLGNGAVLHGTAGNGQSSTTAEITAGCARAGSSLTILDQAAADSQRSCVVNITAAVASCFTVFDQRIAADLAGSAGQTDVTADAYGSHAILDGAAHHDELGGGAVQRNVAAVLCHTTFDGAAVDADELASYLTQDVCAGGGTGNRIHVDAVFHGAAVHIKGSTGVGHGDVAAVAVGQAVLSLCIAGNTVLDGAAVQVNSTLVDTHIVVGSGGILGIRTDGNTLEDVDRTGVCYQQSSLGLLTCRLLIGAVEGAAVEVQGRVGTLGTEQADLIGGLIVIDDDAVAQNVDDAVLAGTAGGDQAVDLLGGVAVKQCQAEGLVFTVEGAPVVAVLNLGVCIDVVVILGIVIFLLAGDGGFLPLCHTADGASACCHMGCHVGLLNFSSLVDGYPCLVGVVVAAHGGCRLLGSYEGLFSQLECAVCVLLYSQQRIPCEEHAAQVSFAGVGSGEDGACIALDADLCISGQAGDVVQRAQSQSVVSCIDGGAVGQLEAVQDLCCTGQLHIGAAELELHLILRIGRGSGDTNIAHDGAVGDIQLGITSLFTQSANVVGSAVLTVTAIDQTAGHDDMGVVGTDVAAPGGAGAALAATVCDHAAGDVHGGAGHDADVTAAACCGGLAVQDLTCGGQGLGAAECNVTAALIVSGVGDTTEDLAAGADIHIGEVCIQVAACAVCHAVGNDSIVNVQGTLVAIALGADVAAVAGGLTAGDGAAGDGEHMLTVSYGFGACGASLVVDVTAVGAGLTAGDGAAGDVQLTLGGADVTAVFAGLTVQDLAAGNGDLGVLVLGEDVTAVLDSLAVTDHTAGDLQVAVAGQVDVCALVGLTAID